MLAQEAPPFWWSLLVQLPRSSMKSSLWDAFSILLKKTVFFLKLCCLKNGKPSTLWGIVVPCRPLRAGLCIRLSSRGMKTLEVGADGWMSLPNSPAVSLRRLYRRVCVRECEREVT